MSRKCRPILFLLLFVCLIILPVVPQPASAGRQSEKLAQLQKQLDSKRVTLKFPGATIGFVLADGSAGAVSTGLADLKTKTPLKPSDRLLAGSIGKTFVAAEALLLAQDRKLALDDKLEAWLGGEKWFAQLPNAHNITLRMLLNHSSGLPNHVDNAKFMKSDIKDSARNIRPEGLVAYILNQQPLFAAGKGFNYADTNYILIGMVIEKAAGRTMYEEITERLLRPLQLNRTIPSDSRVLPEVANGYFQGKPMVVDGKFVLNPQWEWAGGGFASTAEELARWGKALYEGQVLSPESLKEMLQSTTTGEGANYGLGVEIEQGKFGKSYGHDGEFPGYLSELRYFPACKITVAVQVNGDEMKEARQFINSAVDDAVEILLAGNTDRDLSEADKNSVQALTIRWLQLLQDGKYAENWEGLCAELKAKYAQGKWQTALQPLLKQVGALRWRTLKSSGYADPQHDTVTIEYASAFSKAPVAIELVQLKREAGGQWRVASYTIKQ